MAEIAAAAVAVTSSVLKLGNILTNEANFILGVKDGVEQLQNELRWMKSFLKDAETKIDNSNNNLIREWVSDVRDLSYEAEDIIDTFLLKFGPETRTSSRRHFFSFTKNGHTTHKLGRQLEKLRVKSHEISSRRERYGLNADVSNSSKSDEKIQELRASAPYANNECIVGLAETVRILKDKLTAEGCGRSVISILGMGGLGKTTLARKLYNELGPGDFSYRAWVCVSQEYNTEDILKQVIKTIGNPNDPDVYANKRSMEVYLRGKLAGSSFLVVIDDVWEREALESLERAFPDDNTTNGRVIITTRIKHVAELNSQYVHELRYLNGDESWELFCKKTFRCDTKTKCPTHLEKLGKEMVDKCSGLPLALVILGGILSTKLQIISEWELVRHNLWNELKKDSIHVNAVLTLSFRELPDYLKLCFLCVGMFPEDFRIPVQKLMLFWEAEGFLIGCEEQEEASPEDIAQSYFNELVGRNLLQKTGGDWIGSTCRVHDLLRDLAIKQAKEIRFCAFYGESQKSDLLKAPSPRRLAMHLNYQNMPVDFGDRSLQTLHLHLTKEEGYRSEFSLSVNKLLKSLHQRFHLLRVLEIEISGTVTDIQVDKLFNLRYLRLRFGEPFKHDEPFKLPESFGDLKKLQTLYISSSPPVILPKSVGKLQSLKHLLGNCRCSGGDIGKLTGLETLEISDDEIWYDLVPETLGHLRHLSMKHVQLRRKREAPETFVSLFAGLKGLQKLDLDIWGKIEISEIFKRCHRITHFRFRGSFSCTDLHLYAANLQVLDLLHVTPGDFSSTIYDLQRLPALLALRLFVFTVPKSDSSNVIHLACSEVGFPQLRTLHIKIAYGRENGAHVELSVAEGGLPVLTNLHIDESDKLIAPDRLKQLITAAP